MKKEGEKVEVIFVSTACSKEMYTKIFNLRHKKNIDPTQKFLEQIISGIAKNSGIQVISISERPVSASTTSIRVFKHIVEMRDKVKYIYPAFINGKIMRYLTCFTSTFIEMIKILRKCNKKDSVVICDPITLEISKAARLACRIMRVKVIAIVTDIPNLSTHMKQYRYGKVRQILQNIYEKISVMEIDLYDGYIFLTSSMNEVLNKKNKPSIVIEGSVVLDYPHKNMIKDKIIVYAGGIYKKYGVENLVKAFIMCDNKEYELHLYGEGSYVEELKTICKNIKNIKYKGCVLNNALMEIESKATLLVNPRFSNEIYTKYSFPSKTLEYMNTGTPVLTTKLAGIPYEYDDYLYYFDDEGIEGMSRKISEILSLSPETLNHKGNCAQQYVIKNKNNVIQGYRIIRFIKASFIIDYCDKINDIEKERNTNEY